MILSTCSPVLYNQSQLSPHQAKIKASTTFMCLILHLSLLVPGHTHTLHAPCLWPRRASLWCGTTLCRSRCRVTMWRVMGPRLSLQHNACWDCKACFLSREKPCRRMPRCSGGRRRWRWRTAASSGACTLIVPAPETGACRANGMGVRDGTRMLSFRLQRPGQGLDASTQVAHGRGGVPAPFQRAERREQRRGELPLAWRGQ